MLVVRGRGHAKTQAIDYALLFAAAVLHIIPILVGRSCMASWQVSWLRFIALCHLPIPL